MKMPFKLVSHKLCPYVQRAAIVLAEKAIPFERIDIDLANKPEWFLKISPFGKTPVLIVNDQPIFESAVICEYLDETAAPRLHPTDAMACAQHRGWIEFGSAMLNVIAALYNAPDDATLESRVGDLRNRIEQLEAQLGHGPYFGGDNFSLVDAAFAPIFRYFDVFGEMLDFQWFQDVPKVEAWRRNLAERPSVVNAVRHDYGRLLKEFILQKNSALARRLQSLTREEKQSI